MDEQIDTMVIAVRADTSGFGRDVEDMRAVLTDGLGGGAQRAGRDIENALVKAARTGSLSFEDLKAVALKVMGDIAAAAIRGGLGGLFGGGDSGSGGAIGGLLTGLLGLPGRATGGPVSPGGAYIVGERGPELFVPTSSGRIAPASPTSGGRDVRVAIAINAPTASEPQALARSSRQVARAVARALDASEG